MTKDIFTRAPDYQLRPLPEYEEMQGDQKQDQDDHAPKATAIKVWRGTWDSKKVADWFKRLTGKG